MPDAHAPLRSASWFNTPELYSWLRESALQAEGFTRESYRGKPCIAICNTWSEFTHCNAHLRGLAEAVKRGVWQAGGFPLEMPALSLGEFNLQPTAMLYRNLLSMEVEELLRANPVDGVVLLGGCDKTTPGLLMGAASADLPALLVTGGPQLKGNWQGEELGSCTDCRRYHLELLAGRLSTQAWDELQSCIIRSPGHCMTMGTASTLACLAEALGIALPGNGAIPAVDSRRMQLAESAGRQIVNLVHLGIKPSLVLTEKAFENALRALHALGGSTNAILHLIALAGRLGRRLSLPHFAKLARTTPVLADVKPSGRFLLEDFFYAGGMPALLQQLSPLLHLDTLTVTGKTLGENIQAARVFKPEVIRTLANPVFTEGGLACLSGTLAPRGALIKTSAASPALLQHTGRAIVFDDYHDLQAQLDASPIEIVPTDVLVLRNAGPVGGPGMPEAGFLPLPSKLLREGVRDMVRLSDARMSGTAFGTVVVHISPESAVGGPLAWVQTGDRISLDVPAGRLDLLVEPSEMQARAKQWVKPQPKHKRGYGWLHAQHILQADLGCDFDFLLDENLSRHEDLFKSRNA